MKEEDIIQWLLDYFAQDPVSKYGDTVVRYDLLQLLSSFAKEVEEEERGYWQDIVDELEEQIEELEEEV